MRSVNWFDYDSSVSTDVVDDIVTCGSKIENGSLVFITVCADPTRNWRGMKPEQRKQKFDEEFGEAAYDFTAADFKTPEDFRRTTCRLLLKIIRKAFSGRHNSSFHPLLQTLYRDSTWMCTIGGIVEQDDKTELTNLRNGIKNCLRGFFVEDYSEEFDEIPQINITEAERNLLDIIATQKTDRSAKKKLAKSLGFDDDYIEKYKKIIRFVPRYVESAT